MLDFMDRTLDWQQAVDTACSRLDLSPDDHRKQKNSLIIKQKRERSQFATIASGVCQAIYDLRDYISTSKRDYLSTGRLTEQAKDQVEEQVGVLVRTITQQLDALKNSVIAAQQPPDGSRPLINENTAAHLHGTVLVLVEQLHRVTSSFDRCRAVRYQQSLAKELRQHRKVQHITVADPGWGERQQQQRHSGEDGVPAEKQQQQQQDTTKQLLEELRVAAQQAQGIERTMRDISTINQMISTAVMQQAEMIETLYNNAVDATYNIKRGNVDLKKTVQLNRSSRKYLLVLFITAGLLLLFFDWFNS